MTTGYDFLNDAADAVNAFINAYAPNELLDDSSVPGWTATDVLAAVGRTDAQAISLNGHADYYALQPANATPGLLTAQTLASALTLGGRMVFSMGCHAGFNLPDVLVSGVNAGDWADAVTGAASQRPGVFAGNTGFGFGDTELLAYGEDLNRRFAQGMFGSGLTLGVALTQAKQGYAASLGVIGAYDEKTLAEYTFYGLPMWRLAPSTATPTGAAKLAASSSADTVVDPLTGLSAEPIVRTPTQVKRTTPSGSYWVDTADPEHRDAGAGGTPPETGGVQVTHFRPIQPREVIPVSIPNAHGALITELRSVLASPSVDPVYSRPVVDNSAAEPELPWNDVVFPSKLQAVTTKRGVGGDAARQLVLLTGQFTGEAGTIDGEGKGAQVLFSHIKTLVYGVPAAGAEYVAPVFREVSAQRVVSGSTPVSAAFAVDAYDRGGGSIERVVVAYNDGPDGNGDWKFVDLTYSDGAWRGVGALSSTNFRYFVQAVDSSGNVAVTTNKGLYYAKAETVDIGTFPSVKPPTVVIASPGAAPSNGVFISGVDVVPASYACVDPDSVVQSCTGVVTGPDLPAEGVPVVVGQAVPTASPGTMCSLSPQRLRPARPSRDSSSTPSSTSVSQGRWATTAGTGATSWCRSLEPLPRQGSRSRSTGRRTRRPTAAALIRSS